MNRRKFLRQSALAAGALAASRLGRLALPPSVVAQVGVTRKRVIVVGAGLAGLVAAYELTQAGHDVTLLEASTRPGGRIWTLREPFSDGLYAEAGAGRIPETHDLTIKYVKLFGLELDPFYPRRGRQVACFRDRRFPFSKLSDLDPARVPLALSERERRLGFAG